MISGEGGVPFHNKEKEHIILHPAHSRTAFPPRITSLGLLNTLLKYRNVSNKHLLKLRSRQVHAQTLTTAELRLHTLIHPTKIAQQSFFHQEWWKAVPSSAVIGEETGCFSKKESMRL